MSNASLNSHLSKTIYIKQLYDFLDPHHPNHVCLLRKSLHNLKQSSCKWFKKLYSHLQSISFHGSKMDVSLFYRYTNHILVFLLIYVDDILILSPNLLGTTILVFLFQFIFTLHDLDLVYYFLGIKLIPHLFKYLLSQSQYIVKLLAKL